VRSARDGEADLYALARKTTDYAVLVSELGILHPAHGALMIAGGLLFGLATARARVLPRWTGCALVLGVVLAALVELLGWKATVQVAASTIRTAGLVGMGVAILRARTGA
jgi:hypothetical protein